VSLGCPKQELWMAAHKGRINAVMIGVGAAFDYHAGTIQRAPLWMQKRGLEWFYRLCSEPRRLWKRYLVTNTQFVFGAICQLVKHRLSPKPPVWQRTE
jgi:N-acetylglucosaminyldiphosphoundecaprenol N-acetyl-beta-D-mannosaminyltransferase